jgi:hypothetical protein
MSVTDNLCFNRYRARGFHRSVQRENVGLKAISSIVFTIFAISPEEILIASMGTFISATSQAPASAAPRFAFERDCAFDELSALRLVIEAGADLHSAATQNPLRRCHV